MLSTETVSRSNTTWPSATVRQLTGWRRFWIPSHLTVLLVPERTVALSLQLLRVHHLLCCITVHRDAAGESDGRDDLSNRDDIKTTGALQHTRQ
jgi:hypothetical protein